MKYIPLKNFLGKPMQLKTGNVYYEKELDSATQKYEAQFQHSENVRVSGNEVLGVAVAFAEWIIKERYCNIYNSIGIGYWKKEIPLSSKEMTAKELYEKYKHETAKATDR